MTSADNHTPSTVPVREQRKGRTLFLFLVVIFFAPLFAAWLMFFGVIDWKPTGIRANGELIEPPVQLDTGEPLYLTDAQEESLLRDKWTLVFVADQCSADCESSLMVMRQVRLSLGRYLHRTGRALIVSGEPGDLARLTVAFPGMDIVQSSELVSQILQASGRPSEAKIYLVDPLGNLVMMFAHNSEPRPIYDDLKHLLKLSRIG